MKRMVAADLSSAVTSPQLGSIACIFILVWRHPVSAAVHTVRGVVSMMEVIMLMQICGCLLFCCFSLNVMAGNGSHRNL